MAEVIQFNCPACGTMLRLPLSMAAQHGPCPNCEREIIAPDPYRGIGAYEMPAAPPPREVEPSQPFAESPPVVPEERKAPEPAPLLKAAVPPPDASVQVPVCKKPQRAVLVLCCLLTAAVALAVGFALGALSNQRLTSPPQVALPASPPAKAEEPPVEAKPLPPVPMIETPKLEKKPEPSLPVSAAAEASLKAFLKAPDWAARSAYVLFPEKVRGAMEAYSHEAPDGPTAFKSIAVKQSYVDEKTGSTLLVFVVATETFPVGIPVAVKETPGGWLVDWQAFVEFRDLLFPKFVSGPSDKTGRFHLIVTSPPPERAASTQNEHFIAFLLASPLGGTPQLAFVKKSGETFNTFQAATQSGGIFTPVLEVAKRQAADGQSFLEVLKVTATDWMPAEN